MSFRLLQTGKSSNEDHILIETFRYGRPPEREKMYAVLDELNNGTGHISFDRFNGFVKKAQAASKEST